MSKYIDADRLKAEITDLCANANFHQQKAIEESNREDFVSSGGEIFAYAKVLSIITSLQQDLPGVDLDADIEMEWNSFSKHLAEYSEESEDVVWLNLYNFNELALHFYELGKLNAKKEESK